MNPALIIAAVDGIIALTNAVSSFIENSGQEPTQEFLDARDQVRELEMIRAEALSASAAGEGRVARGGPDTATEAAALMEAEANAGDAGADPGLGSDPSSPASGESSETPETGTSE